jgi:hypothetical protein
LGREIKNERLFGDTRGIIDYLDDATQQNLSLRDVDELRQVLNETISGASARERRTLMMVKEGLDDYLDSLGPGMARGNIKDGVGYLKEARSMWAMTRKQETIEGIISNAQLQATGFENGLRVGFRSLAKNKKAMRNFTQAEQEAIRRVAIGGPVENALRAFAWLSPTKTLGAAITGFTAGSTGGLPAAAMAGVGSLATKGAQAATVGNVNNLERLVQGIAKPGISPELLAIQRNMLPAISGANATANSR